MFISCFLMRSSSRSRGPSYSGMFILYGDAIVSVTPASEASSFFYVQNRRPQKASATKSIRVCGCASAENLFAFLFPAEDGFADSRHCLHCFYAGAFLALVDQLQDAARILLVLDAALADGRDPFDQIVSHGRFALNAANSRATATLRRPLQRLRRREQFMPVVDRTHVRISRIGTPLARGVGDHDFGLGANVGVAFAQRDGVAVTLRHLAAVKTGYARRLRQHRLRFTEHFVDSQ